MRAREQKPIADLTADDLRALIAETVESRIPPKLLGVEGVAAALGVSESQVWEFLSQGRIRSLKVGRRRLVPVAAVDEFIADLEQQQRGAA